MLKKLSFSALVISIFFAGCASVPKESIQLNQEVGNGISSYHKAYVNLLNIYFAQKREDINKFILNTYLPTYIKNIKDELIKAGQNPNSFDTEMVKDIVKNVSNKRDKMLEELEKSRVALVTAINNDYLILSNLNSSVGRILKSVVDMSEAETSIKNKIEELTNNKINFDAIEDKFNNYLNSAGQKAGEVNSFYKEIVQLINNAKEIKDGR